MNVEYFLIDKVKEEIVGPNIESNTKIKKTFFLEEIKTLIEESSVLFFVNKHDNLLESVLQDELLRK